MSNRIGFKQLNEEQKQVLVSAISAEEVKTAIFAMHPVKAPSIDGLNLLFFQAYWNIVGQDVCAFCQKIFDTGARKSQYDFNLFDPQSETSTESGRLKTNLPLQCTDENIIKCNGKYSQTNTANNYLGAAKYVY